jgi:hypothetical protein
MTPNTFEAAVVQGSAGGADPEAAKMAVNNADRVLIDTLARGGAYLPRANLAGHARAGWARSSPLKGCSRSSPRALNRALMP